MIFMYDTFGQPCRVQISSTYLIYSRVIIQKSVFRILHGYSIFLAMSFRVSNTQNSEIFNYRSSLFMLSLIRVFLIFDILVYSWDNDKLMVRLRILLQTLHPAQLHVMQSYYIMDFTSMDFISFTSQSDRIIIDHLTESAHFILFRMG